MAGFDYFVVFAEMRTGSNFLEANINAFDGLTCHGEAFNPNFISYPNRTESLGMSFEDRNADPSDLIACVKAADGLNGFRFFNSHDLRVFDEILDDPRCAKIILTRNPIESYVSWKIAKATGQWKLMDVKRLREDTVEFDVPEFEKHIGKVQAFQVRLLNGLQKSGQTAFYLDYEDLRDVEVMNGMTAFMGSDARLTELDKSLKKQNPSPMSDKVENFDQMEDALARLDRFNLNRTPNLNLGVGRLYRPSSRLRRRPYYTFQFGRVPKTPWRNGLRNLMMSHRLTCCQGSRKRHCVTGNGTM